MADEIISFEGEYEFLDNSYPSPFVMDVDGEKITFSSAEHYYQFMKTENKEDRQKILNARTSKVAWEIGRSVNLRPNWKKMKRSVMSDGLHQKFAQNPHLLQKLLKTGKKILIRGNAFGQTFWGVDLKTGKGENVLGKILMEIREEYASFCA